MTLPNYPMPKQNREPRNHAVALIDHIFGDVEGWDEAVAEAGTADEVAQ